MRWTFRPAHVCRLAQITAPQLENFVSGLGLLEPLQQATKPGSYRLYSLTNVYEAALAGELVAAGFNGLRLQAVFAALHASLTNVPASLHATATFIRYAQAVKAIASVLGQESAPGHRVWLQDVDMLLRRWQRTRAPLDSRILALLAARQTPPDEHVAAGDVTP